MILSSTSARPVPAINASTIAAVYAAAGVLWVFVSDRVLHALLANHPGLLSEIQTIKGCAFIALTTVVLYIIVRAASRGRAKAEPPAAADQRISALLESLPDYAVAILSADGRVAIWSAGAELITGFGAAEAAGQPLARVLAAAEPDRSNPARMLAEARAHGSVATEGWHLHKDGSRYRARSVTTALRGRDGSSAGYVHVMRDMSGLRRPAG